jgi:hypothetical protein
MRQFTFVAVSVTFAAGAAALAWRGVHGWGWFLIAALMTAPGSMDRAEAKK